MRRQIAAALCSTIFGFMATSLPAIVQQSTGKTCLEEWRANQAADQTNQVQNDARAVQCPPNVLAPQETLITLASATTLATGSSDVNESVQIHTTIKDLMDSIIDPSADVLWDAVKTVVD